MGSVFKFKQFSVNQEGCAMKINTDGVLLAALAHHQKPVHILDIGTGTGVIALMLAQRFADAQIDAVEIDEQAALTAQLNVENSVFSSRCKVYHTDVAQYTSAKQYDLIVSNPPYFVNDLKNPEKRKELARHADETFFGALLAKVAQLLHKEGKFWLILPVKQAEWIITHAVLWKMFPSQLIHLHSDASKSEFRRIICLQYQRAAIVQEHFYIYESKGMHTAAYTTLLKDFFIGL